MKNFKRVGPFIDFLWGASAAILLALSFSNSYLSLLGIVSVALSCGWILRALRSEVLKWENFFFWGSFIIISRGIFFQDNYSLMVNKLILPHWAYSIFFAFGVLQISILPIVASSIALLLFHRGIKKINQKGWALLLCAPLVMVLSDLSSHWNIPVNPLVGMVKLLPYGIDLREMNFYFLSFSLYLLINLLVQRRTYLAFGVICLFFGAVLVRQNTVPKYEKVHVTLITINQTFTIINQANDFSPNLERYLKQVRERYRPLIESNSENLIFVWNESALIELPGNSGVLKKNFELIQKHLPGTHLVGNISLSKTKDDNIITGSPRYTLLGKEGAPESVYHKRYLVPLDENYDYFPWIPKSLLIKSIRVNSHYGKEYLEWKGIKFGILLCNEIAEAAKLSNDNYLQKMDIVLNPSNVPQMFTNNYESMLDSFAQWANFHGKIPILRTSNSGRATLFSNGKRIQFKGDDLNTHRVDLEIEIKNLSSLH